MRITLVLLVVALSASAGPQPGAVGTPEFEKATALVQQLGHSRFAVREAAGKQLIEMGASAIPALTVGIKSDDEEVRTRSLALLPQVKAIGWKRRADAFLADPAAHRDLPLLTEWEKLMGKPDAGSRELFAGMLRTNGTLLERIAGDPTAAPDAVKARCRKVLAEVCTGRTQTKANAGDLAALFFVHQRIGPARPTWVPEAARWDSDHPCHLLANPGLAETMQAKEIGPAMRRLVAAWADSRPADDQVSHQCFALAVYNTPFPEAVPVLARLANDPKAQSLNVRAVAVTALGKVDDPKARAALADLVSDATPIFRGAEQHVGDHALATLLLATKKTPADYGLTGTSMLCRFKAAREGEAVTIDFTAFPNDEARKRGIRKWKDETAKTDR